MKPFIATWSKIERFNRCPKQFWLMDGTKYIYGQAEVPFETNKHLELGKLKHRIIEKVALEIESSNSICTPRDKHHPLYKRWWGEYLTTLHKAYKFKIETKIGLDVIGKGHVLGDYYKPQSELKHSLFVRGAIDLIGFHRIYQDTIILVDWKTGKPGKKIDPFGQLAMYAAFILLTWEKYSKIEARYIYLDHQEANYPDDYRIFTRSDLDVLKKSIKGDYESIVYAFKHNTFNPFKNRYCRWCPADTNQCNLKIRGI